MLARNSAEREDQVHQARLSHPKGQTRSQEDTHSDAQLRSELEKTDEASLKAFDFELQSFDWKLYLDNYCLGTRHFLMKNEPETLDSSRKHLKRMKFLHYFVQCLLGFIIYYIFNCLFI